MLPRCRLLSGANAQARTLEAARSSSRGRTYLVALGVASIVALALLLTGLGVFNQSTVHRRHDDDDHHLLQRRRLLGDRLGRGTTPSGIHAGVLEAAEPERVRTRERRATRSSRTREGPRPT